MTADGGYSTLKHRKTGQVMGNSDSTSAEPTHSILDGKVVAICKGQLQ